MYFAKKNLDVDLTLDKEGDAKMAYVENESGESFYYHFFFTGELGKSRDEQALCIGYEILSWFDTMKALLAEQKTED